MHSVKEEKITNCVHDNINQSLCTTLFQSTGQDRNEDKRRASWDTQEVKRVNRDIPICPNRLPAWQEAETGRGGKGGGVREQVKRSGISENLK